MPVELYKNQKFVNPEAPDTSLSGKIVKEIENHYAEAGSGSLKFVTFSHLADYSVAERAVLANRERKFKDEDLTEQLEDRYGEAAFNIMVNFGNPAYEKEFFESDSFSKKLYKAYVDEGISDSKSADKTANQLERIRDQILPIKINYDRIPPEYK
jgi:hypothetical protein